MSIAVGSFVGRGPVVGPRVVRVEGDFSLDGDVADVELVGLLLVSVSGHVLGVAPAVGWSDEDVLSY
jgi:hypothetical protein